MSRPRRTGRFATPASRTRFGSRLRYIPAPATNPNAPVTVTVPTFTSTNPNPTVSLPPGSAAQKSDTLAVLIIDIDNFGGTAGSVSSVVIGNGGGNHNARSATSMSGTAYLTTFYVWQPRSGDNSVTINTTGLGSSSASGRILFIPAVAATVNLDISGVRSSANFNVFSFNTTATSTATPFVATDLCLIFSTEAHSGGTGPARGIPGLSGAGVNVIYQDYVNGNATCVAYDTTNSANITLARGDSTTAPVDSCNATINVYAHT